MTAIYGGGILLPELAYGCCHYADCEHLAAEVDDECGRCAALGPDEFSCNNTVRKSWAGQPRVGFKANT